MSVPAYTVFHEHRIVATGDLDTAVRACWRASRAGDGVLAFENRTGRQVDFDLRGDEDEAVRRAVAPSPEEPRSAGRGRPRLGVVAREVTLLPRHWEWLNAQPGGASVALRKLVDAARKDSGFADVVRTTREATGRFLTALAGDLPRYEDATRALFAGDRPLFTTLTEDWPSDVRDHARAMASGAFLEARPGEG